MKARTARWLLAPLRQLRTLRLMAHHGPTLPYDTAWALTTLHTAPDDTAFLRAWSRENPGGAPGIHYDHWHKLEPAERQRRLRWLHRHGHSPVQRLGLEPSLIQSAGIHVLDWGRPSDAGGQQLSAQPHPPGSVPRQSGYP
jgi:hypothetical protein